MQRPVPVAHMALDYREVMRYIQHRTGRDPRDWNARGRDYSKERQDFWVWFLEDHGALYRDGSLVALREHPDDAHLIPGWAREILGLIFAEFGDCVEDGKLTFFVEW